MLAGGAQTVMRVTHRRARRHRRSNALTLQRLEISLLCSERDQLVVNVADHENPQLRPWPNRGGFTDRVVGVGRDLVQWRAAHCAFQCLLALVKGGERRTEGGAIYV